MQVVLGLFMHLVILVTLLGNVFELIKLFNLTAFVTLYTGAPSLKHLFLDPELLIIGKVLPEIILHLFGILSMNVSSAFVLMLGGDLKINAI